MPIFVFDIESKQISTRTEPPATPVVARAAGAAAGVALAAGVMNTNGKVWSRGQASGLAMTSGAAQRRFSGKVSAVGQAAGIAVTFGRSTSKLKLRAAGAAAGIAQAAGVGVAARYVTRSAAGVAAGSAVVAGLGYRVPADPYRSQVVLHMPFDGTEGSTTFTDVSPAANSVAVVGPGPFISQAAKVFGTGALRSRSTYASPTGYLVVGPSGLLPSRFRLDLADFTIEAWFSHTGALDNTRISTFFSIGYERIERGVHVAQHGLRITAADREVYLIMGSGASGGDHSIGDRYALPPGPGFTHIAFTHVVATNTYSMYVNGVLTRVVTVDPYVLLAIPADAKVLIGLEERYIDGVLSQLAANVFGLDDLRVTKGVARTTFDLSRPLPAY